MKQKKRRFLAPAGGRRGTGWNFGTGAEPIAESGRGKRLARRLFLGVEDHGAVNVGQKEHFVELLHAGSEFEECGLLPAAQVDDDDAADEFFLALLDGKPAEDVFFADLAEADQR